MMIKTKTTTTTNYNDNNLESKRKFDSIRLDDKYRFCFIILDIDDFEKKLNDSKLNIVACRDLIEKLKRISEYKIQLNEFNTNIEYLWQFLNEKILITQSNPDDCLNFSQLHFIQRRNNIIKIIIHHNSRKENSQS